MAEARLIGVDWGTTSFRAALMDGGGTILDHMAGKDGLLSVVDRDFEGVLERAIGRWDPACALPVIASGMVTSRTGWRETANCSANSSCVMRWPGASEPSLMASSSAR